MIFEFEGAISVSLQSCYTEIDELKEETFNLYQAVCKDLEGRNSNKQDAFDDTYDLLEFFEEQVPDATEKEKDELYNYLYFKLIKTEKIFNYMEKIEFMPYDDEGGYDYILYINIPEKEIYNVIGRDL